MTDVYTNTADDNFPGARTRTRPGTAPGEETYNKVVDADGKNVSNKPANRVMLEGKKARLEHEKKMKAASQESSGIFSKLILLAIFLPLLSHFMFENYHFNMGPTVRKHAVQVWRHQSNPFAPRHMTFTTVQLADFDGSDPSKPIYIAVAGEVFDVSANPRMYGKGGAYNMMAGRDASRAFITGCFQTHLTHDLRGLSKKELESLDNWSRFFSNSEKYFKVGDLLLPRINPNSPIPPPCNVAAGDEAPAHHKQGGHGAGGNAGGGGAGGANPHAKTQGKSH